MSYQSLWGLNASQLILVEWEHRDRCAGLLLTYRPSAYEVCEFGLEHKATLVCRTCGPFEVELCRYDFEMLTNSWVKDDERDQCLSYAVAFHEHDDIAHEAVALVQVVPYIQH